MEQCVSLAFDGCQSLSHQYLVPLPEWLLCAASVGLFPEASSFCTFPTEIPRIMLSHFKPRQYKVRHATPSDLERRLELEAASWDVKMRTPARVIEERLATRPTQNFIMTNEGMVVGVVFFQFIRDSEALLATTWDKKDELAFDDGQYLQLLDIFVDSQVSLSLGGNVG